MVIHIGGDRRVRSEDIICVLNAPKTSARAFLNALCQSGLLEGETNETASYIIVNANGKTRALASNITATTLKRRGSFYDNI